MHADIPRQLGQRTPPFTRSAILLSIDEKSQIRALDGAQVGPLLKPRKCGTMTRDYQRHGTTTFVAAFNGLDGVVLGHCMQRHTHWQFSRFLNAVGNFFSEKWISLLRKRV